MENNTSCVSNSSVFGFTCTTTTKVVVILMDQVGILDLGYHVYLNSYYSRPELSKELPAGDTLALGTIWANRNCLPTAVAKGKFKENGTVLGGNCS